MGRLRDRIKNKCKGRCAYCGKMLDSKWHIDHLKPIYRNNQIKPKHAGTDNEDNMLPSCSRCNLWKKTFPLDVFRSEIKAQIDRLKRDSSAFRMALDYGLIEIKEDDVVFYFESLGVKVVNWEG